MNELILKLAKDEDVTNRDIENELYEICEREHSSCNWECPVYRIAGHIPFIEDLTVCKCFKDGYKMRKFILEN